MCNSRTLILLIGLVLCGTVASSAQEKKKDPARLPAPPASDERWQAGLHYTVLIPGEESKAKPGKIELVELFLYTNGISKRLMPYLQKFLAEHPNVEYVRIPAIVFPHTREQARMYFTLKELGREDLHAGMFDWVKEENRFPVYHTLMHPAKEAILDLNLAYAKKNGIDPKVFLQVYQSREIDNQVITAEIDTHGYHVNGTSTLVVNGRYSTSLQRLMALDPNHPDNDTPQDFERLMKLIDYLIASESKKP